VVISVAQFLLAASMLAQDAPTAPQVEPPPEQPVELEEVVGALVEKRPWAPPDGFVANGGVRVGF
jgi:hypothetical protein